jgi:hypothetical protein
MTRPRKLGVAAVALAVVGVSGLLPRHAFPVQVVALPTPRLSSSSIELALHAGEEATTSLLISNTSGDTLEWSVRVANLNPQASIAGMRVVVDRSKGQAALPGPLIDALTAAGAVVQQNYAPLTTILPDAADVLILRDQIAGYTAQERSAVAAWLSSRGGVYMSADGLPAIDEFNLIADAADAGFSYQVHSAEPGLTTGIVPHRVTTAIQALQVAAGIERLTRSGVEGVGDLARYPSGDGLAVHSEIAGGGRLVATADELETPASLQTAGADNLAFLLQAIAWAGHRAPWVSAYPVSGQTPAFQTDLVTITVGPVYLGGTYTADIEVRSPAIGDSAVTIPLVLQVTGDPQLALSPTSLDFGLTYTSIPKTQSLQVANPGTDVLVVSAVSTTLPALVATPPSFVVAPGETAWVDVTFTPDADGPISGDVVIEHNAEPTPRSVPVTGTGVISTPPVFSMAPESLVVQLFTGATAAAEVVVASLGGTELDWSLGSLPAWLAAVPAAGALAPADTDTIAVTFDALGPIGVYTAVIPVTTNDPLRPLATLTAIMNVTGIPDIDVPNELMTFPDQLLGGTSSLQMWARNRGTYLLTGTVTTDDTSFAVSPANVSIAPGAWARYTVRFSPPHGGPHAGSLVFATNDPDESTASVPMTGVGVDPAGFTVAPESLAVTLRPDTEDVATLSIHNAQSGGTALVAIPTTEEGALPFVFFDDFEDGDFDGWIKVASTGTKEVTDVSGAAGTARSYREADAEGGYQYRGIYHLFDQIQPRTVSFWVRTVVGGYTAFTTFRTGANTEVVVFYAQEGGTFYCNADNGGDASFHYEGDRWYHIEFRNIDWTTKTFDYLIDGVVVKTGIGLRNAAGVNEVSRIDLYNYSLGTTTWWDEILISSVPPSWLTPDPHAVTVDANGNVDFEARFSTRGLSPGTYRETIHLQGNQPENPYDVLTVPVVLTVDSTATGVHQDDGVPRAFALAQNVPNPFNPVTTIAYDLPEAAEVTLAIFDVSGRCVRTLVRGRQPAGRHRAMWSGTDDAGRRVASGVYFYRLLAGANSATRKMVMLR